MKIEMNTHSLFSIRKTLKSPFQTLWSLELFSWTLTIIHQGLVNWRLGFCLFETFRYIWNSSKRLTYFWESTDTIPKDVLHWTHHKDGLEEVFKESRMPRRFILLPDGNAARTAEAVLWLYVFLSRPVRLLPSFSLHLI